MIELNRFYKDINYLRVSVTDRCNLRCMYCMPEDGIISRPHDEILTFEEIAMLAGIFASMGISRIRLTGGEPLARKGIIDLAESLTGIDGVEEVSLTTNGILLSSCAQGLRRAGIRRINISLDTLRKGRFKKITGRDCLHDVLAGLKSARQAGFNPIKLNMVVMRGINDDEIIDFAEFALCKGLILRFIEFMNVTPLWDRKYFIPIGHIKKICAQRFALKKLKAQGPGPAEYYKIGSNQIGFIKTDKRGCRSCSRLRLTSAGELKACLYEPRGVSLRTLLRNSHGGEKIKNIIRARLESKRDIDYRCWKRPRVYMSKVGG